MHVVDITLWIQAPEGWRATSRGLLLEIIPITSPKADEDINPHNKQNLLQRSIYKVLHCGTFPQNSDPRLIMANECQYRTIRTEHVALVSRHVSEANCRTHKMPACRRSLQHTQRGHRPIPGLFAFFSSLLEKLLPTIKDYISVLFKN